MVHWLLNLLELHQVMIQCFVCAFVQTINANHITYVFWITYFVLDDLCTIHLVGIQNEKYCSHWASTKLNNIYGKDEFTLTKQIIRLTTASTIMMLIEMFFFWLNFQLRVNYSICLKVAKFIHKHTLHSSTINVFVVRINNRIHSEIMYMYPLNCYLCICALS